MKSKNITPIDIYESEQYKLDAYFDNLPETKYRKDYIEDKINKLDSNLIVSNRKDKYFIKQKRVYCPHCYSKDINENGYFPKDIILVNQGLVKCKIKRYECKTCKKGFSADISCIVDKNFTVSHDVKDTVQEYYSIDHTSVRKIQEFMKKIHGVSISHQEVEDIIVDYSIHYNPDISEYSGHYAFDALWIKIKELSNKWVFLLALMDVCHDTIVAYKIVEHETEKEVYKFLSQATQNQPRIAITTDLKQDYRKPISDLKFEHQFCHFHFKQNVNKTIREYVKENNLPESKIKEFKSYLPKLYAIFDLESMTEVDEMMDNLRKIINEFPEIIQEIFNDKFAPNYRNLTKYIENPKIEHTSNMIERIFGDLAPKHIKRKYKTVKGFLSRFSLKLKRWDQRNAFY